ncbi:SDR family NAD(P)-dependent oxidoreductase [Planococcus sp. CAU13]|uniref:SDR family NAD(P)-dependent oxidoreductase n=1 Tax=Planococcus sp. CAU13 TaxID=1541197 RepID=UPI0006914067|nr:SDR family NAD(P)-dependent oxidoreductase [Planococcus sp. CAU13]
MKHALVIGGTGMLARTSLWLADNGYHVSVIGRNPEKMQRLIEQNPAQIAPVLVDYTNKEALEAQLLHIQQKKGPVGLVVAWIHTNGSEVISCLTDSIPSHLSWKLFHVNGSSSNLEEIKKKAAVPSHVQYHQIHLGFKLENGTSRWLTHEEISGGVIKAIMEEKAIQLVGTLTPWEERP